MSHRSVAVVGGGVTGLVAARTLATSGVEVDLYEADDRLGGQVRTVEVAGHPVDVGAEALHLAGPHVEAVLHELDLRMIRSNPGSAWIWTGRSLRRLPAGVGPAGPTRLGPVLRSRILSPAGLARAALEPLVPRGDRTHDVGAATFLAHRFGHQVADRLVDPVLGSLHAGDVSRLSLRAATPYVAAQADRHRSLLLAQRHRRGAGTPSFVSFPDGLVELVDALAATDGINLRLGATVEDLACQAGTFRLRVGGGRGDAEVETADAVVLALPAHRTAGILRRIAPASAATLDHLRAATVATVVAAYPRASISALEAFDATGVLIPSSRANLLKAATFLGAKWPHLEDPELFLVRLSAGRAGSDRLAELDDGELARQLHADLAAVTGLDTDPVATHVERWPRAIAQLEVGHLDRMAAIEGDLQRFPTLVLAGAPYQGIGLATCIRAGQDAARRVLERLDATTGVTG